MKVLYDTKLMRPACVLVCAAYGIESAFVHKFEPRDWLLAPTPDMHIYETTPQQLKELVVMTEAHRKKIK